MSLSISMRVLTFALLGLLVGCDTADPPPGLRVSVFVEGAEVQAFDAEASDALAAVPTVEVRLDVFREVPTDPALAQRYRALEPIVAALSVGTGEAYEVGYYRVASDSAPAALLLAIVDWPQDDESLTLATEDVRIGATPAEPGTVFLPVRVGDTETTVRVRPVGIGGAAALEFEGRGGRQRVVGPRLDVSPAATIATIEPSASGTPPTLIVTRGTETDPLLVVARQGTGFSAVYVGDGSRYSRFQASGGEEDIEVYVFRQDPPLVTR